MRKGLLIWVVMLALACTMSFATVLSFAETSETPAGNPVVTDDAGDVDVPDVTKDVDVDPVGITTFEVTDAWTVTCPATVVFNGSEARPDVTVTLNNGDPVDPSEYDVAYADNNGKSKTAKVTVTPKSGSTVIQGKPKEKTFSLVYDMGKCVNVTLSNTSLPVKFKKNDDWKVIPVAQKPTVKSVTNKFTGATLKNGTDYTFKYSNANSKNAGTYSVTVTAKAGSDYTGTLTATYKITPIKIDGADFYVYGSARYYTGKKLKPKTITIGYYDARCKADMDLVKGTHYTVTKAAKYSNNTKIGYANIKITIKGKGNFTGSEELYGSFTIGPEKATVKSAKVGKKKVTLKWKKSKHADGYRIEYFGWKGNKSTKTKVVYVKSKKTVKKTLTKLKSGYTYDIWLSPYKTVKGTKIFVYENPKTVKIK